jgi:hypothetical protein
MIGAPSSGILMRAAGPRAGRAFQIVVRGTVPRLFQQQSAESRPDHSKGASGTDESATTLQSLFSIDAHPGSVNKTAFFAGFGVVCSQVVLIATVELEPAAQTI